MCGGGAKKLLNNYWYEYNWKIEITKWKLVSYNFATNDLVLHNLRFVRLKYQI